MKFLVRIIDDDAQKTSDRLTAVNLLINRILGMPAQTDLQARIEMLERAVNERGST